MEVLTTLSESSGPKHLVRVDYTLFRNTCLELAF